MSVLSIRHILFASVLLLSACGPSLAERQQLVLNKANNDFGCPKDKISVSEIGEESSKGDSYMPNTHILAARGCNKQGYYTTYENSVFKKTDDELNSIKVKK